MKLADGQCKMTIIRRMIFKVKIGRESATSKKETQQTNARRPSGQYPSRAIDYYLL